MKRVTRSVIFAMMLVMLFSLPVLADTTSPAIPGPLTLVADNADHTYLGKLVTNKFDSDSVFNEFGTYGSRFSATSICNQYGIYGGSFSVYSPFNEFTVTPPLIIDSGGNVLGRLTVNKNVVGAVDPYLLYGTLTQLGM